MSLVESVSQLLSSTLSPVKVGQARDHYLLTLSDNDSAPISVPCSNVWLHGPEDRCAFVSGNVECQDELSYIDYVSFVFCAFGDGGKAGAIMIAFIWALILFVAIGITATDFLCPSLFVISKTLGLSQNVAGVTLLAFGNGSPDIFAAIAGIRGGRSGLVVGGLFGVGTYVSTFCIGAIFSLVEFKVLPSTFIRDVVFYMAGASWMFYLFIGPKQIRLWDAIGFLILYAVYVFVVIVGKYVDKTQRNAPPLSLHGHGAGSEHKEGEIEFEGITADDDPAAGNVIMKGFLFLDEDYFIRKHDEMKSVYVSNGNGKKNSRLPLPEIVQQHNQQTEQQENSSLYNTVTSITELWSRMRNELTFDRASRGSDPMRRTRASSIFTINKQQLTELRRTSARDLRRASRDILGGIAPIDLNEWDQKNWGGRSCEVVKSPIRFFMLLTTPMANVEGRHDWNKPLSVLHCITGPIFVLFATKYGFQYVGPVPLAVIVLLVAAVIAVLMVFTSKYETPPFYYTAYSSYLGFVVAITWIFCISNEVIAILRALGIALELSDEILGLTLLAWGNGMLDMFSNISIARAGLPRMAMAACFGGPLLSLLVGVGIPSIIVLVGSDAEILLEPSPLIMIIYVALGISLSTTLIKMFICKFFVKKTYGYVLMTGYFMVMVIAVLTELQVITW